MYAFVWLSIMGLALHGCNSVVSNNVTIVCSRMSISRFKISHVTQSHFHANTPISDEASVIRDILLMKHQVPDFIHLFILF